MSINGKTFEERLPFLLERAAELGIPVEVRPRITRAGAGTDHATVVSVGVTLHAHVGELDSSLDIAGAREAGTLDGPWLDIVGEQDLAFAANVRRHRVLEVPAGGIEPAAPQTYGPGRVTAAAVTLLEADRDEIRGAVRIRTGPGGANDIEELTVDWSAVTAPTRSPGAVTLAIMARSLLHGDPVDLSGFTYDDRTYAGIAAAALSQLARQNTR
jgi:hypothetical protein